MDGMRHVSVISLPVLLSCLRWAEVTCKNCKLKQLRIYRDWMKYSTLSAVLMSESLKKMVVLSFLCRKNLHKM